MWAESKGLGKGTSIHFTIKLPTISTDISLETLHNAFAQSEFRGPGSVAELSSSFLRNGQQIQVQDTLPNNSKLSNVKALILLGNHTNQLVMQNHLESLVGPSNIKVLTGISPEEDIVEALGQVDCVISDFAMISQKMQNLTNKDSVSRITLILLEPQIEWESEKSKKLKELYPRTQFVKTPLRQLKLDHELRAILNPVVVKNSTEKKEESAGEKTINGSAVVENSFQQESRKTTAYSQPQESHELDKYNQQRERDMQKEKQAETSNAPSDLKKQEPEGPLVLVVEDNLLNQKVRCLHS